MQIKGTYALTFFSIPGTLCGNLVGRSLCSLVFSWELTTNLAHNTENMLGLSVLEENLRYHGSWDFNSRSEHTWEA